MHAADAGAHAQAPFTHEPRQQVPPPEQLPPFATQPGGGFDPGTQ